MNYNLPFYGKKGTISSIKEDNRNYIVNRYDFTGKPDIVLEVPKNNTNYEMLIDNYYTDLKDYLITNNNKYEYYKKTRSNKKIDNKTANLLKVGSIAALAISIPLLNTHEALGYLGITLDVIAIPLLISSIKIDIQKKEDKKKTNFINKYNELEHRLRIYNEGKTKSITKTTYNGVKSNERTPKRDLRKVLERKKAA